MHLFMLMAVLLLDTGDANILRTFVLPEESDEYLNMPFSFDFSADGRLYLLDRDNMRVLVWNADGSFAKGFGQQGDGPGELFYPIKIAVADGEVWIWDFRKRMSIFDLDGNFQKAMVLGTLEPRNFAVLGRERALLGFRQHTKDRKLNMVFQYLERAGELGDVLKSFRNNSTLEPVDRGSNNTRIKAYGPEIDLQRDGSGRLYIGFSEIPELYLLDKNGTISETRRFDLPTGPPDDSERKVVEELSLPLPSGGRFVLSEVPGLEIDFSHDKAYWTNFLIKDDKVAFVLTPLGTLRGVGNGFHRGSYYICDLSSGKVVGRGAYVFPEDSTVLYRNGRILATIAAEDADFQVVELGLKGL